jgi:thioredoxin-related protein
MAQHHNIMGWENPMRAVIRSAIFRLVLSTALVAAPSLAHADAGATADQVITHAKSEAAAEHKNILLTFGASWCGNCHLFDKFLADPVIHSILAKAFVFADLTTGEHPNDKHHANIPGGEKLQAELGGKTAGWPYIVMLDPEGKLLADSTRPANLGHGGNIGYPVAPYEIDWFMEMLQKSAPSMSGQDTATIRNWLTTHSGKH